MIKYKKNGNTHCSCFMKLWRMENMFKKSLLALALAGVATTATAVETSVQKTTVGVEGVAAADKGLTVNANNSIKLTLGAEYAEGDIVKITAAGGSFADKDYELKFDNTADKKEISFGLLNSTSSVLTFRVTNVADSANPSKGGVYSLTAGTGADAAVAFKLTSIAEKGTVTIETKAETAQGTAIDSTEKDKVAVFEGVQQYALEITPGEGTIDVAEMRKKFAGDTYKDASLDFTVTAPDAGSVTGAGYEVVITGDFNGVGEVKVGDTKATIAKDKSSAKAVVGNLNDAALNFALPTKDADKVALTAQTFTADVKVLDADDKAVLTLKDDANVATWKLNGDTEFVEIMPFTDAYNRYIAVTNNGTVEGDITVELYFNNKMVAAKKVGTAGKYAVTDVTAAVNALAAENEVTGVAGIRVTTNAPASNIEVSALYYNKEVQDHVKVN
ncbi:hypothetical protein WLQ65_16535 [Pseudoalteromonas piscicida]|uniref:hypothetical protein n=1 Tax=Pseudoalteromonas piscicida TaxID=43662 RepID=UPI0030C9657D